MRGGTFFLLLSHWKTSRSTPHCDEQRIALPHHRVVRRRWTCIPTQLRRCHRYLIEEQDTICGGAGFW
jgi:hypothetical protein